MKRFLLGTAIVGVALTSCVKEEATNPQDLVAQKITFDAPVMYSNQDTRANVYGEISSESVGGAYSYPKTEDFTIYAVSYEGDFAGWDNATNAAFSGTAISYDRDVDGWAPKSGGKYYYWENGKKMAFAAYSPANLEHNCVPTYSGEGLSITDFEVSSDASKQYDLMFSTRIVDQTSANMDHSASYYSGIPIKFQHALSSIRFSIANSSNEDVVLTGIELSGVKYKGNFNEQIDEGDNYENVKLYDRTPNTGNVNPVWVVDDSLISTPYTAFKGTVEFLSEARYVSQLVAEETDGDDICNQLLLMPQELTETAKVTVHYTVNGAANTKEVSLKGLYTTVKDKETNEEGKGVQISAWEIGKRYTYRLFYSADTADRDKIYFAPSTEDWQDVDVIVVPL